MTYHHIHTHYLHDLSTLTLTLTLTIDIPRHHLPHRNPDTTLAGTYLTFYFPHDRSQFCRGS